jgi:hypothetical protein
MPEPVLQIKTDHRIASASGFARWSGMSDLPSPAPPRSRTLRTWLIVMTALSVLAILPVFMMAGFGVMATASGRSDLLTQIYMWVSVTWPIAVVLGPIVGPIAGWIAWGLRRERLGWIAVLAPWAWPVMVVILWTLAPA